MSTMKAIHVRGFTSIRDARIELGRLNVCVGANGAGKSNLISFLHMLSCLANGDLQQYVGRHGTAATLLHDGPQATPSMNIHVELDSAIGAISYSARLAHAAGDTLMFVDERLGNGRAVESTKWEVLGTGHRESKLIETADRGNQTAELIRQYFERCHVYHFHDTSSGSRIRNKGYIEDNRHLHSDGGNLAAYLYRLHIKHPTVYHRIRRTIQQIAPFLDDFDLKPSELNTDYIILNWRAKTTDYLFGPHQLSDGTIRAIALVVALLQPREELPRVLVVDEPENGLHPYAIEVVADLLGEVSQVCQVILSTQSTNFVDQFDIADVLVVDRENGESRYRRLSEEDLGLWLEEYSVGELWQKNVFGGKPLG